MLFSIIVALMVLLVAVFWVYQGLFSSLIMFLETLVAFMLAINFYESLHDLWSESIGPGIGLPLALMSIFLFVLIGLRTLTDRIVPGNVNINMYADRAGGGIVGLFTGLILVGTALVALQMLPIGAEVFTFERVQEKNGKRVIKDFYFKPDQFVVGLANMLSNNRFGAENPFDRAKPDLIMDLYSARCSAQTEDRQDAPSDALVVHGYWDADRIDQVTQSANNNTMTRAFEIEPLEDPNKKLFVAHVEVKSTAQMVNTSDIRFRLPQFRIVGPPPGDGSSEEPKVYLALGMTDLYTHVHHGQREVSASQVGRLVRFGPHTSFILNPGIAAPIAEKTTDINNNEVVSGYKFDVAFEVPLDFEPWYMEFKRGARFDFTLDPKKELHQKEAPDYASMALGKDGTGGRGGQGIGAAPKGRVHVATATGIRASSEVPFAFDTGNVTPSSVLSGSNYNEGKAVVVLGDADVPDERRVKNFVVPDGKTLVQVEADPQKAESMYGRAMSFAANAVAQIYLKDANGQTYFARGMYAQAPVNGQMTVEIQYWPNAEVEERCLQKHDRVTKNVMDNTKPDQRRFGYLFLVPPGTKIESLHAGGMRGQSQPTPLDVP